MSEQILNNTRFGKAVTAESRNRVLRNTYWLLALSLLPTVLGCLLYTSRCV